MFMVDYGTFSAADGWLKTEDLTLRCLLNGDLTDSFAVSGHLDNQLFTVRSIKQDSAVLSCDESSSKVAEDTVFFNPIPIKSRKKRICKMRSINILHYQQTDIQSNKHNNQCFEERSCRCRTPCQKNNNKHERQLQKTQFLYIVSFAFVRF